MNTLPNFFTRETPAGELQQRVNALLDTQPKLRRKEIADQLQVPEAALIDHQCGVRAIRLNNDFKAQIEALPELGYIMSLTRNRAAVHERKGAYDNVKINGPMGLIITADRKIDLRIILSRWAYGFAVAEETPSGQRHSLQFFDRAGVAIQKIYLQPESNFDAYLDWVSRFIAEEHTDELSFSEVQSATEFAADKDVDVQGLRSDWQNMTDVHQFFAILRRYKVSREQAFRLAGESYAQAIAPEVLETVLSQAAVTKLPLMCFVGNHGNIQIHTGPVSNIKVMGPWLNILDPEFNLHLLQSEVKSAWLVRKPTVDGHVTSLEFYDAQGETIAQFFGAREEGSPENPEWRKLAESTLNGELLTCH